MWSVLHFITLAARNNGRMRELENLKLENLKIEDFYPVVCRFLPPLSFFISCNRLRRYTVLVPNGINNFMLLQP